jgi:hypothetical protein
MKPQELLKRFTRDLTTVEVNTILKIEMTGEKMPDPRHGLVDIAEVYQEALNRIGTEKSDGKVRGSHSSFQRFHKAADRLLATEGVSEKDQVLLRRISVKSAQIGEIFRELERREGDHLDNDLTRAEICSKNPASLPLTEDQTVILRKIWELGTEEIVLQTVVQLDGDVITRVHPGFATPEYETLHSIHNDSVRVATQSWQFLVRTLKELFEGILSKLWR